MRSRCMSLLPRTTLHSDSEQNQSIVTYKQNTYNISIFLGPIVLSKEHKHESSYDMYVVRTYCIKKQECNMILITLTKSNQL
jgi:hypothetical protein